MNAIPLFRACALLPFVNFLEHIGAPTEQLFRQSKLPTLALTDPEALTPLYLGFTFLEQAIHLEGIDNFGILIGQQTEIADLGEFGKVLRQAMTLYDVCQILKSMVNTINSCEGAWLTEENGNAILHHRYNLPPTSIISNIGKQQAQLYSVVLYLKVFRMFLGQIWRPIALHLQAAKSKSLIDLEIFSDIPLFFEQPSNGIVFPRSLLSKPLLSPTQHSLQQLQQSHQLLQSSAPIPDFPGSLQQLLLVLLRDGYPDISLAAAAAGMTMRSFQRRLAEADLNYSQLVEHVRFSEAIHLLKDPTNRLTDIAFELGYTDAANFTRAFRRWTGASPSKFRRLHLDIEATAPTRKII